MTVQRIAIAYGQGQSDDQIAADFDLELAEVHAALAFYFAHREAVDTDIAAYDDKSERIAKTWSDRRAAG